MKDSCFFSWTLLERNIFLIAFVIQLCHWNPRDTFRGLNGQCWVVVVLPPSPSTRYSRGLQIKKKRKDKGRKETLFNFDLCSSSINLGLFSYSSTAFASMWKYFFLCMFLWRYSLPSLPLLVFVYNFDSSRVQHWLTIIINTVQLETFSYSLDHVERIIRHSDGWLSP